MQTLEQLLPPAEMGTAQQQEVMELSYAELNLLEDALRHYLGGKSSDWVCSTDEQVALNSNQVNHLVGKVINQRAAASWSD